MKTLDLALLVYDILNEVIAEDDKTIENLMFFRDKLKGMIDDEYKTEFSV